MIGIPHTARKKNATMWPRRTRRRENFPVQAYQWCRRTGTNVQRKWSYQPHSREEEDVELADPTLMINSSRIDSTTAAFTEFATPIGPPLVDKPFWQETADTITP